MSQPLAGGAGGKIPLPHCPESDVEVSESVGTVILILNCISPGFGTLVSSCLDRKGCNCTAFLTAYAQSFACILCCYGWYWSIKHGLAISANSKGV